MEFAFSFGIEQSPRPSPSPPADPLGQAQKQRIREVCLSRAQKIEKEYQTLFPPEKCAKSLNSRRRQGDPESGAPARTLGPIPAPSLSRPGRSAAGGQTFFQI